LFLGVVWYWIATVLLLVCLSGWGVVLSVGGLDRGSPLPAGDVFWWGCDWEKDGRYLRWRWGSITPVRVTALH